MRCPSGRTRVKNWKEPLCDECGATVVQLGERVRQGVGGVARYFGEQWLTSIVHVAQDLVWGDAFFWPGCPLLKLMPSLWCFWLGMMSDRPCWIWPVRQKHIPSLWRNVGDKDIYALYEQSSPVVQLGHSSSSTITIYRQFCRCCGLTSILEISIGFRQFLS